MKKNIEEIIKAIHQHSEKGISLFKEGHEIHNAYQAAPDTQNLVEEVEQFTNKLKEGLTEFHKATGLQNEYFNKLDF